MRPCPKMIRWSREMGDQYTHRTLVCLLYGEACADLSMCIAQGKRGEGHCSAYRKLTAAAQIQGRTMANR